MSPLKMPITSRKQIISFPELRGNTTFNGLPGLLADSLPDKYGNQLIDVCHSYKSSSKWVSQHALSVNGNRGNISKNDLLAVAKSMNIKKANQIIKQINEVTGQWPLYAEQTRVESKKRDAIESAH